MTGVLIKRRNLETDTQRKHYVMMKAEVGVMYKPRNAKDCQKPARNWGSRLEQISPRQSSEELTSIWEFWLLEV